MWNFVKLQNHVLNWFFGLCNLCSVANTAKRAFLIWLSVMLFGNEVTILSGLGTSIVISGVLLYNKAQDYDRGRKPLVINFEPKFYDKKVEDA